MISRYRVALAFCFALLCMLTPTTLRADNLVVNGGFNSGDWTGWTIVNDGGYLGFTLNDGGFYTYFGAMSSNNLDIISQTLSTTPGQAYQVSFLLADTAAGAADFKVLWNDELLTAVSGASSFGFTEYTLTASGTGSDTLTFEGYNVNGYYNLDDVSVDVTPEPSSIYLLGTALLVLCGFVMRRKGIA
jgi:hypothetical protein